MADFCNELATYENGVKRRNRVELLAITKDGKVLCDVTYRDGLINLPGGAIDKGETPTQAAVRECMEEAGWRCDNPRQIIVPPGEWVYTIDNNEDVQWLIEGGWKEESNRFVVADALEFKPTSEFGAHGDGAPFYELTFDDLYQNAYKGANGRLKLPPKLVFAAKFRLAALDSFKEQKSTFKFDSEKPRWMKW